MSAEPTSAGFIPTMGCIPPKSHEWRMYSGVVRVGTVGFLLIPDVADYIAGVNEEIPESEAHARIFLENRLKQNLSGQGICLLGRKVALAANREVFYRCNRERDRMGLQKVLPISHRTLQKMFAYKYGVVLSLDPDKFELCINDERSFRWKQLSCTYSGLADAIKNTFSQASPDLVHFFEQVLSVPDDDDNPRTDTPSMAFSGYTPHRGDKPGGNADAWKNLARIQPIIMPLVNELRNELRSSDTAICLIGDLAGSKRFGKILQNFLRLPVISIGDMTPLLQSLAGDLKVFQPPMRLRISSFALGAAAGLLLLNLHFYKNTLAGGLEYMKGIESLRKSISEIRRPGGSSLVEDISWLNSRLRERRLSWTRLFNDLEAAKPDRIQLESMEMAPKTALTIDVRGFASTVEDIRMFLAHLQKLPNFRNVFLSSYRARGMKFQFLLTLECRKDGEIP